MSTYSLEHVKYLKKERQKNCLIRLSQILIIITFFFLWELLSRLNILNTFLFSSPSNILKTIINLLESNHFFNHVFITLYEIIISSIISIVIGFIIATISWWNPFLRKVIEPYLTIINSLPKVALGPLIIIWFGTSINSIIVMSLMISLFITIINLQNAFIQTNKNYIILLQSMNASKLDIYKKVIIKANIKNIINTIKINFSMSFIGLLPLVGEKIFFNKCYSRY